MQITIKVIRIIIYTSLETSYDNYIIGRGQYDRSTAFRDK